MKKNSFNYDELINCGKGDLFGPGNAKLPLPPMLMFDRITEISEDKGAFKKKGYVKEISLGNDKSYFDTNISSHHHFFDTKTNELIDIDSSKIELKNIPNPPKGKSIKEIDVVINVENDSQ